MHIYTLKNIFSFFYTEVAQFSHCCILYFFHLLLECGGIPFNYREREHPFILAASLFSIV